MPCRLMKRSMRDFTIAIPKSSATRIKASAMATGASWRTGRSRCGEEAHVAILSSTSYPMVKSALNRQHVERRIVLELPGFLVLAAIVSSTDLVATVPRTIGETLAATGSVRVFPCPVKIPNFSVKQ